MPPRVASRCIKPSCVHFYRVDGTAGRCRLGLRFDSCASYTPKPPKPPVSYCDRGSCVHHYRENWRGRCALGLKRRGGRCPRYEPRSRPTQPTQPTGDKKSKQAQFTRMDAPA